MTFDVEDASAMADALDIIGEHKDGWKNFWEREKETL
jgi:hypothetical protein